MHRLKKYPNRRLYDTTDSKYVTLHDLRQLIVDGESISVADSRDGSDLTRVVLMQILAEQEAEGHEPVLTNRALEQIIRFYGDRLGNVASRYIEQSMLTLLEHQDQFRSRMRQLSELNPLNIMRQALDGAAPRNPPPPTEKPVAEEPSEADRS
ncbi:MAG: polyhydroxyalkanoate synthesis repressor PhaR [Gammaproteobacteria bacterium]|nr:polyhydroxyalkanoate synthesis repressor PhaR [Gammaproteobacteria bacterium]